MTTTPPKESTKRTVLVVDDSAMDRLLASSLIENLGGWSVQSAENGSEALAALGRQRPDLVLTDLLMPGMDGLELVQAIRANHPLVPVILMTGHGSEDIAIKALKAGAASYVPKKSLARDLEETLEQVMTASKVDRDQRRLVQFQTHLEANFVLENDPTLIPPLVGHLEENLARMNLCEPSGLVLLGVALHEALSNAIYHGNLEVSSELREQDEHGYYKLAEERRRNKPWGERRVYVTARMSRLEAVFVVKDDGAGFDPSALPNPTDPANLERVSGRGLLLIQTFMDRVEHNETGNQITMSKRRYG
ncbi:MAG TPA: response regulator [Gemmataceae bacterium]|nr:response regulator [Gemmataceae bacterium]